MWKYLGDWEYGKAKESLLLAFLFSHFQQLDTLLSRYGIASFPDWQKLARAVQHTLFADIRLTLLYAEIDGIHLAQTEREKWKMSVKKSTVYAA